MMLTTTMYILLSWFIYTILGFLASSIGKDQKFDAAKFGGSLIWAFVVILLAAALDIAPTAVIVEHEALLTNIVTIIANSGFGMALIYSFAKIWTIIMGFLGKLKPPTPTPT